MLFVSLQRTQILLLNPVGVRMIWSESHTHTHTHTHTQRSALNSVQVSTPLQPRLVAMNTSLSVIIIQTNTTLTAQCVYKGQQLSLRREVRHSSPTTEQMSYAFPALRVCACVWSDVLCIAGHADKVGLI